MSCECYTSYMDYITNSRHVNILIELAGSSGCSVNTSIVHYTNVRYVSRLYLLKVSFFSIRNWKNITLVFIMNMQVNYISTNVGMLGTKLAWTVGLVSNWLHVIIVSLHSKLRCISPCFAVTTCKIKHAKMNPCIAGLHTLKHTAEACQWVSILNNFCRRLSSKHQLSEACVTLW